MDFWAVFLGIAFGAIMAFWLAVVVAIIKYIVRKVRNRGNRRTD